MSRLFPEELSDIVPLPKSVLFPEIGQESDQPVQSMPPAEPGQGNSPSSALDASQGQDNPSKAAFRAGLEAFMGGNEDAALAAWGHSQEPEAKRGVERIQNKRSPSPQASDQSMKAYKDGLEYFLMGDKTLAKGSWDMAYRLDPNNREAKRGLERLSMPHDTKTYPPTEPKNTSTQDALSDVGFTPKVINKIVDFTKSVVPAPSFLIK